jgi:hypothetical protein
VRAAAPLILVAGLTLAGCAANRIKPNRAEQSVVDVVAKQTGFHPTDVACPSGVPPEVGVTFDRSFTGPEPKPYVAHMRIAGVHGARVEFVVNTEPTG